jgi:hypothetical protein
MREFLGSMSMGTGALVVAIASLLVVWVLCIAFPLRLGALWAVVVPFTIAFCVYWAPVEAGSDTSEYSAWQLLIVGSWFIAGFVPSVILVLYLRRRRRT